MAGVCSLLSPLSSAVSPLFATWVGSLSIVEILIAVIIIGAAIGITLVALRAYGLNPPPWVMQIFWIVLVAVAAVLAIRIVMSV